MPNLIDLTGKRFGRYVVLRRVEDRIHPCGKPSAYWLCRCDCNNEKEVQGGPLRRGQTKSCGCWKRDCCTQTGFQKATHGHSSGGRVTPTYTSWRGMKNRCFNINCPKFPSYGGRGITICDHWLGEQGFEHFLEDMGERPQGKTLDRFPDNDGNYEKSNCRWATPTEQADNTRASKLNLAERQKIAKLVQGGSPVTSIAVSFGVTRQWVRTIAKRLAA